MTGGPAVRLEGVRKSYDGHVDAVGGLDLAVPAGQVFGLLGPNGAGKTTVLRAILGLVRPSAGRVTVLGRAPGSAALTGRVGALVESPAFHPHLSGRANLTLLARYLGLDAAEVAAALRAVDLIGPADARFRTYSLGMKQRLGVAAALLGDPELMVLDEPTNGTDPAGMAAMRELIRAIAASRRTVLLSSHLLGEVEQVCDRVAVLHRGRLLAEGSVDEIRSAVGGTGVLALRVDRPDLAIEVLTDIRDLRVARCAGAELRVETDPARAGEVNRRLVEAGVEVSELRPLRHTLEEAFLGLTATEPEAGLRAEVPA